MFGPAAELCPSEMKSAKGNGSGASEFSLTFTPRRDESAEQLFRRVATNVDQLSSSIVHLTVFASADTAVSGFDLLRRVFGRLEWPVNWIESAARSDPQIAGIQLLACRGNTIKRVERSGRVIGSVIEDGELRQCFLGGLTADSTAGTRPVQTQQVLDSVQSALAQNNFDFGDIVRTWFFLDDMLSWYREFNQVRTAFYSGVRFRSSALPASTGVSGRNPVGSALLAGVWALQPIHPTARTCEVGSPLQCAASRYGSSFSRAMGISTSQGRRLTVSGTASIASGGETLHAGNPRAQIAWTMEVVEEILRAQGFQFTDITRATAYFKKSIDIPVFEEWRRSHGGVLAEAVPVHCDICRDDLLFELEADAWGKAQG